MDPDRLEATRTTLAKRLGDDRVAARAFDIVDEDAVDRAVESIESDVGAIDVLVNNAGIRHREPGG